MNDRSAHGAVPALSAEQADRLSALFDRHADRLYRLARRLVSHRDDAFDLVQDTFLKAARSAESLPRGPTGEEAWLVRVLVNTRRDQWRKEAVRRRHPTDAVHQGPWPDDPERAVVARATVWKALDRLSPRRRAIVVMYEIEGLPAPAIASLLGITAITVRWHLSRGRRELARHLGLKPGERDESQLERSLVGRRSDATRGSVP